MADKEFYVTNAGSYRADILAEKLGITVAQAKKIKSGEATLEDFKVKKAPVKEANDVSEG